MGLRYLNTALLFFTFFGIQVAFAQEMSLKKVNVSIQVSESDTRKITPVMICITNVRDATVHIPPYGKMAGEPTYPASFFKGIHYTNDLSWSGPIRKMSGKGAVNGQRTYVYGEAPSLPYWHEPVMYQTSGNFTIDLSPGKWRISIEHGNEYLPVQETFEIKAGEKTLVKKFFLKRWINLPALGWYSGDVHTHHPLDKPAFKKYMLQMAKAEDIHLANVLVMGDRIQTDFTNEGFGENFRTCLGNVCLVPGQEDPRSDFGHIIALNIDEMARDTAQYNYYDMIFKKVHQKKESLIGFAHFAYRGEGVTKGMALYAPNHEINFVELLQNTKINTADYYDYLNMGFRISAAAGSDFPWGSTIGDGRTFVYTGGKFTADKWFKGLKAGHSFVSNGPAILFEVNGKIPGMEIRATLGTTISLKIKALSNVAIGKIERVEIHNNDGLLLSKQNESKSDSLLIQISHRLLKSQWLTAAVYCSNGALAHTSAVFCIVDGKPVHNKETAPALIQKQLSLLDEVRQEEKAKHHADPGIIMRADKAQQFYENLLKEITP
ncbi:MAG: CehA/McbA family metallohydrolase [Sphingobacteriaceae bacterium]